MFRSDPHPHFFSNHIHNSPGRIRLCNPLFQGGGRFASSCPPPLSSFAGALSFPFSTLAQAIFFFSLRGNKRFPPSFSSFSSSLRLFFLFSLFFSGRAPLPFSYIGCFFFFFPCAGKLCLFFFFFYLLVVPLFPLPPMCSPFFSSFFLCKGPEPVFFSPPPLIVALSFVRNLPCVFLLFFFPDEEQFSPLPFCASFGALFFLSYLFFFFLPHLIRASPFSFLFGEGQRPFFFPWAKTSISSFFFFDQDDNSLSPSPPSLQGNIRIFFSSLTQSAPPFLPKPPSPLFFPFLPGEFFLFQTRTKLCLPFAL